MKVKVNRPFFDKYTKQRYIADQILEVEDSRGEELLADGRGLVDLVEEKKESKAEKKAEPKEEKKAEPKAKAEEKPKKAKKKG